MPKNRSIHFIGISGTAMASLARAFKIAGFKITGSEAEHIFPPMSNYLVKNKIRYYAPFNADKVGKPDEIVIGNAHYSAENPEVAYARKHNIELEHFPRFIEKYLIKKNSVVVAGTYAKTTTTAMLAWVLDKSGKNPNYMLGGIPINFQHGAGLASSDWSVVEGDEYPAASPWDFSPKFDFYHPKFLLLTSAEWDHMDIFKTKKSYLDAFKKLVASVPKDGLIVAKIDGENLREVLKSAKCKIILYAGCHPELLKGMNDPVFSKKNFYYIDHIKINGKITEFVLKKYNHYSVIPRSSATLALPVIPAQAGIPSAKHRILNQRKIASGNLSQDDKSALDENIIIGKFTTQLLGKFNLENWCGALALALELGVPVKILQKAVADFKGVKRRLEIRAQKNGVTIIDDFAHSPSKAKQSVMALKIHFPKEKIYVIFEPNRGGRSIKCLKSYNNVFKGVNKIFIPKLSNYKPKPGVIDVSGAELAQYLSQTHKNVSYEENNEKILAWLKTHAKKNTLIAFLGSRDFGGMIEKMINKIKTK